MNRQASKQNVTIKKPITEHKPNFQTTEINLKSKFTGFV